MEYNYAAISNRIYIARTNKKLKQIEVCNALGISQSAYSKIETGKVDISISILIKLSKILDVSAMWLIGLNNDFNYTDSELFEIEQFKRYIRSRRNNKN